MKIETVAANNAFTDAVLWDDIRNGKRRLTWRIGHDRYTVTKIYQDGNGALLAEIEAGCFRIVKPNTRFTVSYCHHSDYDAIAQQILDALTPLGEIIMQWDDYTQSYEFRRVVGELNGERLTQGVDVSLEAIATQDVKPIIERLLQI